MIVLQPGRNKGESTVEEGEVSQRGKRQHRGNWLNAVSNRKERGAPTSQAKPYQRRKRGEGKIRKTSRNLRPLKTHLNGKRPGDCPRRPGRLGTKSKQVGNSELGQNLHGEKEGSDILALLKTWGPQWLALLQGEAGGCGILRLEKKNVKKGGNQTSN